MDESPTGNGACLVLHIPANRTAAVASDDVKAASKDDAVVDHTPSPGDDVTAPVKESHSARPAKIHIPRILFMDDEPDIRTIVDKILSAHDFDITCTSNGEQAIDAYYRAIEEECPYDVLLLDLEVVGGMGGKDTIAILRQDFPHIKAVVTTGYLDDMVLSNHREHGFSGVLTKPFQMEDLISVLSSLAQPVS
jgi:CheY-like chemotaxis protein